MVGAALLTPARLPTPTLHCDVFRVDVRLQVSSTTEPVKVMVPEAIGGAADADILSVAAHKMMRLLNRFE